MTTTTRLPSCAWRFRAAHRYITVFLALGLLPLAAAATPPVPGQPTATCDVTRDDRCFVSGEFTLSATVAGADHYRCCRSDDTDGQGGCDVVMTTGAGESYTVRGDHLPSEGLRRAYYVSACDAGDDCTPWQDAEELYVAMDRRPPALEVQHHRLVDSDGTLLIGVEAVDAGSGVGEVRALINLHAGGGEGPLGYFSWRDESLGYLWPADRVPCAGGGFASKHPTRFNPTAVTLVDCTHATDGDRHTVKLRIARNSTGEPPPIGDVFLWARDFGMNRTPWIDFDHDLLAGDLGLEPGELFGYSGINDAAQMAEVEAAGIPVNLAFLMYLDNPAHPHYWRTVDTAGILDDYRSRGVRAVAVFENFLFEIVPDDASPCFQNRTYRLRPDWLARLDELAALHGPHLDPADVAMILMQSEINDRCALMDEVRLASAAVKQYFPDLPLTLAYGATHGHHGFRQSQPPPASLPEIFDGIGLFSYNLYDVNHPLEPRNATGRFYNPEFPQDPATVYGDLLGKLLPHQEVHLIFDAHFSPTHQALGWTAEDLAMVALNYADFMLTRPEVVTLVGFHWRLNGASLGMNRLPQLAVDSHVAIACNYFPSICREQSPDEDRPAEYARDG